MIYKVYDNVVITVINNVQDQIIEYITRFAKKQTRNTRTELIN